MKDKQNLGPVVEEFISVRCMVCKKSFAKDSDDFYSVHGNICKGMIRGIVGDNLDGDKKVVHITVYCEHCLIATINGRGSKEESKNETINQQIRGSLPARICNQNYSLGHKKCPRAVLGKYPLGLP